MNYILFDGETRDRLLPFTYTKPVADIRIGILTIREKWERCLRATTTSLTEEYLEKKFPLVEMEHNVFINASYIPTLEFMEVIRNMKENEYITYQEEILAFYSHEDQEEIAFENYKEIVLQQEVLQLKNTWDLFLYNEIALKLDFEVLTTDELSADIPDFVQTVNSKQIFIEEGAVLNPCILNATDGPIYIGKDAVVLDGAMIRGNVAIGEKSVVKMGAKIYGATTIGPNCKVGGEIKNVVIFGNSNKGHDGYLGNAVVGEWCNLGANTNTSNLKNTLSEVVLWSYESGDYENTNQQFCGVMMGDYTKTGINTMINTGTVIGISAHIFGAGFPDKFVSSFSWGNKESKTTYELEKSIQTAFNSFQLSGQELSENDIEILTTVYELTKKYRIEHE